MSNIIHLHQVLSNLDPNLKFENPITALKIIRSLMRIEKINQSAFRNIGFHIEGFADGLKYSSTSGKERLKENLKKAIIENRD